MKPGNQTTETRFERQLELAKKGNPAAMVAVAQIYEEKGTDEDINKAIKWYFKAAEKNNSTHGQTAIDQLKKLAKTNGNACNYLGFCYHHGHGNLEKDSNQAYEYFHQGAKKGDHKAKCNLANYFLTTQQNVRDRYAKAADLYFQAAESPDPQCSKTAFQQLLELNKTYHLELKIGLCYWYGYGTNKDGKKALEYYMKAVNNKSVTAKFNIALCYEQGTGNVKKDIPKAIEWYFKAAKSEPCAASKEAFKKLKELADDGNTIACRYVATCYLNGYGVKKSAPLTIKYLKQTIEQEKLELTKSGKVIDLYRYSQAWIQLLNDSLTSTNEEVNKEVYEELKELAEAGEPHACDAVIGQYLKSINELNKEEHYAIIVDLYGKIIRSQENDKYDASLVEEAVISLGAYIGENPIIENKDIMENAAGYLKWHKQYKLEVAKAQEKAKFQGLVGNLLSDHRRTKRAAIAGILEMARSKSSMAREAKAQEAELAYNKQIPWLLRRKFEIPSKQQQYSKTLLQKLGYKSFAEHSKGKKSAVTSSEISVPTADNKQAPSKGPSDEQWEKLGSHAIAKLYSKEPNVTSEPVATATGYLHIAKALNTSKATMHNQVAQQADEPSAPSLHECKLNDIENKIKLFGSSSTPLIPQPAAVITAKQIASLKVPDHNPAQVRDTGKGKEKGKEKEIEHRSPTPRQGLFG